MNNLAVEKLQKFSDKYINMAIACMIGIAWLFANIKTLEWLLDSIIQTSWLNKISVISVAIALISWSLIKKSSENSSKNQLPFSTLAIAPAVKIQPLLLLAITSIAAIALEWTIELPQISAFLFLLGSYGLCGLFLDLALWRKGLAIAVTIAIVLPFSLQFTSGLGFAARILTSHAVEQILAFGHIAAISSHDIIVLENGIAHVDLPCSGLRSLWTGTLFLLGVTWLEGRKLGFRWLLVYAGYLLLLILANIGRVLLLTITTFVLKQPLLADLIHVPLGLISFTGACILGWAALRFVPTFVPKSLSVVAIKTLPLAPNHDQLRLSLISVLVGIIIFANFPRPNIFVVNLQSLPIHLSIDIKTEPLKMSPIESEYFRDNAIATKQRFKFGNLSGSMLLVSSNSWRTHHAPELCLALNGLKVDTMTSLQLRTEETSQLKSDFPMRWLTLEDGKMSAMYWFQSAHQTTDDLITRIWSEVSYGDRDWIMVSVLFDQTQSADNLEVQAFANSIRGSLFSQT